MLTPVQEFTAEQIKELRIRERATIPIFARYLNVSEITVKKWEAGKKNPAGSALKLLNLVNKRGLAFIA